MNLTGFKAHKLFVKFLKIIINKNQIEIHFE